jgi:hypothetical protein
MQTMTTDQTIAEQIREHLPAAGDQNKSILADFVEEVEAVALIRVRMVYNKDATNGMLASAFGYECVKAANQFMTERNLTADNMPRDIQAEFDRWSSIQINGDRAEWLKSVGGAK